MPTDTNTTDDVVVHDAVTGNVSRASVNGSGAQGRWYNLRPAISADGRYVAFDSDSFNLVPNDNNHWYDVFRRDLGH